MKKLVVCILVLALSLVTFVACAVENTTPTVEGSPVVGPNVDPNGGDPNTEPAELSTVSLAGGNYVADNVVYYFNKEQKTIEALQFNSYDDYKNRRGAELYLGQAKYINSAYANESVYFKDTTNNKNYYLALKNGKPTVFIASGSSYRSTTLRELGTAYIEPANGTYVSDVQERRVNNVTEEFYFFFVLTDSQAKVYVSDTDTAYSGDPLHVITDYVEEFVAGYNRIRVPHTNGNYYFSVTFKGDEITFVNSSEETEEYSGSGKLTKLS